MNKKDKNADDSEDEHFVEDVPADGEPITITAPMIVDSLKLDCGVQGIGRACQRLIDYGRKEYMRQVLFCTDKAELLYYVSPEVSPQNAALIARR
jgi:hypothetical protein